MSDQTSAACIQRIQAILAGARAHALRSVNEVMLSAYWEIGREIVEEEQRGRARAGYGKALIKHLSQALTLEFGKGFGPRNLRYIRQFYLTYSDRIPPIAQPGTQPVQASALPGHAPLNAALSWTHYRLLMRIKHEDARHFYEVEAARSDWSSSELERQISSLLFERLAQSRDKEAVMAMVRQGLVPNQPADLIKDPYVLEFTGLPERGVWQESDLEQALMDRLQQFLLELGSDLFFVARQKRLTIDGDHFYIDLVFYHRILRCFLLIDLKTGRLTQQDIGQMLLYVGYYQNEQTRSDENPPVGLILCTDKNDAAVRYTLSTTASQIFASRYQLHLPTEQELRDELIREREQLELVRALEE
ncbi:MAG: PDDEXK nuclease domain-containing protein [Myxococcota bacterium]